RLRSANVLIAGACGLGGEVIKNLVLAGVNSLTILDHENVNDKDTYGSFLIAMDSIGQNRAAASLERAQALNPMVKVTAETFTLDELPEKYLEQFSVVCVCGGTKDQIISINNKCRENGSIFFTGEVFGAHGYCFFDLIDHSYVEEVKEKVETGEGENKQVTEETKMVKKTESFIPYSVAMDIDWTSPKYSSRLKRLSPSVFILNVLHEFKLLHGRVPSRKTVDEDKIELLTIKNSLLDKFCVPQEILNNSFAEWVFGQMIPVCAIIGGVLSQEIIKAVSKKDAPLNNFFFFHPDVGMGTVEALGY
ncbi:UNVERIFIED_CONTAM: hypothetical protein GTU68_047624, partial [Idotea baltica]|nr:hypothetical protein [Idotea baltica]